MLATGGLGATRTRSIAWPGASWATESAATTPAARLPSAAHRTGERLADGYSGGVRAPGADDPQLRDVPTTPQRTPEGEPDVVHARPEGRPRARNRSLTTHEAESRPGCPRDPRACDEPAAPALTDDPHAEPGDGLAGLWLRRRLRLRCRLRLRSGLGLRGGLRLRRRLWLRLHRRRDDDGAVHPVRERAEVGEGPCGREGVTERRAVIHRVRV